MSYFCDACDKTIKDISQNKHFISLTHKELDRCKDMKLTIKNTDIN